ncbi:hypothetical protein IQ231_14075 [Cuspidothrix issatschenkoi LEGE 03284]|uniref:hypothetical protein n=1 Tax=Cuspidothrix issatschenkoi TaxID=230752 RepID=UPI001882059C|nr:hypothetical protein [Cuspidothrix issatschenkoi]MBE9232778.1 hypothetical protein [Cuspidothrix issatschenkoi LEGE 03284]
MSPSQLIIKWYNYKSDTFKNRLEITGKLTTITVLRISGGRSRGLGVVKLDIDKMWWLDVNNNPEKLLTYLEELVNSKTGDKLPSYKDGKESKQKWTQSLVTYLTENPPTNSITANSANT